MYTVCSAVVGFHLLLLSELIQSSRRQKSFRSRRSRNKQSSDCVEANRPYRPNTGMDGKRGDGGTSGTGSRGDNGGIRPAWSIQWSRVCVKSSCEEDDA
jgi:hypothetical protein